MKAGHAGDDGGVIAEAAVAVNFAEVGEQAFNVVEGLRALGMASQFGLLPGGLWPLQFLSQDVDAFVKFCKLTLSLFTLPGRRLNGGYLALNPLQFLLRFLNSFHIQWERRRFS